MFTSFVYTSMHRLMCFLFSFAFSDQTFDGLIWTERCRIGYEEQKEWYFFSHKDKKYPTGTRTNRATMAGFWKATGRDKAIYDKNKLIGMRKTLVFYKGRAPNGLKTDWIMHEYRLESEENGPPQEEGWVVCRAFKKRTNMQTKSSERWDSIYFYEDTSGMSSFMDPVYSTSTKPPNVICKQEVELNNANFLQYCNEYVQLPQLESPSPPLIHHPSLVSMLSENKEDEGPTKECTNAEKVTDWRALDKFVASQLSQEERNIDGEGVSNFESQYNSDMGLLLLDRTTSRDKFDGLLSVSTDCDIGICI
ncbi:hypothetical protein AQUCO_00700369v1 [Aquilegia coerulea]|uniref:NAC domain-containing protein n=1 Tax=Aquilegia coerulea TaxID=218851 RepID=A0A2G5EJV3_AQUCA|nr:hypothetical protein AQUCO_00700369v1 [Aquilegia coerulea]